MPKAIKHLQAVVREIDVPLPGVKRLVPFHHDPGHDDETLDRLVDGARGEGTVAFEIIAGTEGLQIDL